MPPGQGIPQAVPRVVEGRQLNAPPTKGYAHIHQFPRHAVSCRRPEHQRQKQIRRRGRDQQHSCVDIRVKDAVHRRNGAAGEKPHPQHAPRHGAGDGKEQHRQPKEPFFPAEGHKGKEDPCRRFHRHPGEKGPAGEKTGHGIHPPQERSGQIPPPPQGDPGKAGRSQKEQIVHQGIEGKHAVHIHHRHRAPPFRSDYRLSSA